MLKFVSYAEPRNGNAKNHNTETHNDNKKEFSCGAIVYKKEGGKILFLIVHSKRNNEWGFPKGHIEKGESEKETAKREIFEETGIKEIEFIDDFRYEEIYNISKDKKEKREKRKENQKQSQTIEKHSIYFLAKGSENANCRHCGLDRQFLLRNTNRTMTGIAGQAKNDNANACDDDDNSYEIDKCKWLQLDAVLNHLKFDNQKNMLKEANKKIGGR